MPQPTPGYTDAIIKYLRNLTGLNGATDPSVVGAANTLQQMPNQRAMELRAVEAGMSPQEYMAAQAAQQNQQMPPR